MEAKKPVRMYGDLTEDQVREIYQDAYGPIAGGDIARWPVR
jgi:hypothetical protein